ncbi:MAG TPA: N-acetyl sugar amidotransferase [Bacteroidia bacterium]|jgi:N-acetyl sugar amidotransferase|nr:N-acetyl sugar amidotransferase [Bacteroidia bacterium]
MLATKKRSLENNYKICGRCIYDSSVPSISFDEKGDCNYCKMTDNLIEEYGTGKEKGIQELDKIIIEIKSAGKNRKYDCVVGVSGGTDSSYMLHWAIEKGLRPLAVHYDNTYNTAIATQNITNITSKLNIDLYTHVVDNNEVDDIYRSFFIASVPELDACTDIALAETMYRAANKFDIKHILEGHSFIEEGISPLGKNYFDGKYIASIHKQFGKLKMKTFPNMPFWTFIKWIALKKIKKIRPYWYLDYNKEDAKKLLKEKYGWQDYGGHHLENRMTAFSHSVYFPQKFDIDYRNNTLSAKVRNGKMNREEAIKEYYETPPFIEEGLVDYIKKRMNFSDEEFEKVMKAKPKYWYEYPTYKKRFERLRPLFKILYKANLVPKSFYMKYCFPVSYSK